MIELNFPNPVSQEKDFYGRQEKRQRIVQSLLGSEQRPVLILGERRVGKTSLHQITARQLGRHPSGRFIPLFMPPASAIHSLNDYAREALQTLCSYLGKSLQETGLVDDDFRFRLESIGQFIDAATRLLQAADGRHVVLCIDEFDALLIECAGPETDRILGLTDNLIERSDLPLTVFMTMTRLPQAIKTAYQSSVLATGSEVIDLGPFPRPEAEEMIRGLVSTALQLDAVMDDLYTLSGGHPYVVKLLLDRLLYLRGHGITTLTTVTPTMLDAAVAAATRDPRALHALSNIYKIHFNRKEQELLLLLAEQNDALSGVQLQRLAPPYVTATKRLARRGYLARRPDGGVRFHVGFLGEWLRHWEEYEEELDRLQDVHRQLQRLNAATEQPHVPLTPA